MSVDSDKVTAVVQAIVDNNPDLVKSLKEHALSGEPPHCAEACLVKIFTDLGVDWQTICTFSLTTEDKALTWDCAALAVEQGTLNYASIQGAGETYARLADKVKSIAAFMRDRAAKIRTGEIVE
jgi:hypothetical protein